MKVNEIKFVNGTVDDFLKRCVFNGIEYDGTYKKALYDMIHDVKSIDEFIDAYLACDEFKSRQAYAVLSERCRPQNHWYKIREALGDNCFKTASDVGGVKIGNEGFSIVIRHGCGDGVTRCAVLNKGEWNSDFLKFETSIEGDNINIYSCDCGNDVVQKFDSGRYGVYAGYGFVVFEKWD